MTSEVEALYAAAAWKRFDDEISDELLRAVTSAFALIAVADGDLAEAEDAGFLSVLRDHPKLFPQLSFKELDIKFKDVCSALLSDPDAGRQHALQEIAAVRGDPAECDLVYSAAQIAMAADNRGIVEESVLLTEICHTLDIAPGRLQK
jgi:tellurite resistance protein